MRVNRLFSLNFQTGWREVVTSYHLRGYGPVKVSVSTSVKLAVQSKYFKKLFAAVTLT